jgi:copper homeostasis protein (lipoprotein)
MRALGSLVVAALATGQTFAAQDPAPHAPPPGQHVIGVFVGTLPCADCSGIRTELTLFARGSTSSGTASYWLKETYLGRPEKDTTFESGGSWTSEAGQAEPKRTVYRLTEARSRESRLFLKASDDELRLLDRSGHAIESKLDYALRRQPVPAR